MTDRISVTMCLILGAISLLSMRAGLPAFVAVMMAAIWVAMAVHVHRVIMLADRTNMLADRQDGLRSVLDLTQAPGMDEALAAACRERSTAQLIEMHNEGVRVGAPWPSALHAIERVLHERGVELCPCGAPPDGLHKPSCEVTAR